MCAGNPGPRQSNSRIKVKNSNLLSAAAYILWVPALYIVLTEKRKEEFAGWHGGQALVLWTLVFAGFFGLRFLVNLLWRAVYNPYIDLLELLFGTAAYAYIVYCGLRSYQGLKFKIPH